jgi:hypothetical protein
MLIPAFFLILLVGWVLDRLFIDEIEDKKQLQRRDLIVRKAPAVQTDRRPA